MVLFFLMIFDEWRSGTLYFKNVANGTAPADCTTTIYSVNGAVCSHRFLWIFILYFGAYWGFRRSDLKWQGGVEMRNLLKMERYQLSHNFLYWCGVVGIFLIGFYRRNLCPGSYGANRQGCYFPRRYFQWDGLWFYLSAHSDVQYFSFDFRTGIFLPDSRSWNNCGPFQKSNLLFKGNYIFDCI